METTKWERVRSSREEKKLRDIAISQARKRKYTVEETRLYEEKKIDYKTRIMKLMNELLPFKSHMECGFLTSDKRPYFKVFYPEKVNVEVEWSVFEEWEIERVYEFLSKVRKEVEEMTTISKLRTKFHLVENIHKVIMPLMNNERWNMELQSGKMFLESGEPAWSLNVEKHEEWLRREEQIRLESEKLRELREKYLERSRVKTGLTFRGLF